MLNKKLNSVNPSMNTFSAIIATSVLAWGGLAFSLGFALSFSSDVLAQNQSSVLVKSAPVKPVAKPPVSASEQKLETVNLTGMRKDKKIVVRLSHVTDEDSVKQKASLKFKQVLEAKFPGRVVVDIYPNNTLFRDREEMEALQLGIVEIIVPSISKLATIGATEFEVFDLPFLFPSEEKLHEVQDGEIGKNLGKGLEKRGIKLLSFWDNGFKSFSSKKPINTIADFSGQRFRIQTKSAILIAQMEVLGVKPIPMAFADVAQGFRDNLIEGTENPLPNLLFQDMYKEQKNLLLTEHGYLGYAVLINNIFWSRLPEDIKSGFEESIREATIFERNYSKTDDALALETMKKNGLNIIKPDAKQLSEFKTSMVSVHENFMKTPNRDVLVSIYKVVNPELVKNMEAQAAAAALKLESAKK